MKNSFWKFLLREANCVVDIGVQKCTYRHIRRKLREKIPDLHSCTTYMQGENRIVEGISKRIPNAKLLHEVVTVHVSINYN
jgi:hypothetical protein